MSLSKPLPFAFKRNLILGALRDKEYQHLYPYLEPIALAKGKTVYGAGDAALHAYFLVSGMISLLAITEDGKAIEVGMVGNEGMVGLPIILGFNRIPHLVVTQLPCRALRIRTDRLKAEFNLGGQFHDLLLRYTDTLITQLSQSASCNMFHTVKERLCRWLLIARDRVQSDTLCLTQEFISQMIGAPRTSVTTLAGSLQKEGLVIYQRGKIVILDPAGLESASCECYGIVKESLSRYIIAA
jgi:CRP-like cAMP-binding protein